MRTYVSEKADLNSNISYGRKIMNEMIDRHLIFLKTRNKNLLITQTQLETCGRGGGQLGTAGIKLTLDHRKFKKIADIHSGHEI
jgi:hypothetical protein